VELSWLKTSNLLQQLAIDFQSLVLLSKEENSIYINLIGIYIIFNFGDNTKYIRTNTIF
jgi:hypothetical protein